MSQLVSVLVHCFTTLPYFCTTISQLHCFMTGTCSTNVPNFYFIAGPCFCVTMFPISVSPLFQISVSSPFQISVSPLFPIPFLSRSICLFHHWSMFLFHRSSQFLCHCFPYLSTTISQFHCFMTGTCSCFTTVPYFFFSPDDLPDRNCDKCPQCCVNYDGWLRFQSGLYKVVRDPLFDLLITLCIILNTMFLAMEHHGMSGSLRQALDIGNKVRAKLNLHQ